MKFILIALLSLSSAVAMASEAPDKGNSSPKTPSTIGSGSPQSPSKSLGIPKKGSPQKDDERRHSFTKAAVHRIFVKRATGAVSPSQLSPHEEIFIFDGNPDLLPFYNKAKEPVRRKSTPTVSPGTMLRSLISSPSPMKQKDDEKEDQEELNDLKLRIKVSGIDEDPAEGEGDEQ